MEPLGAAGSILTITEALITLGRIIKSLQKVPVELVALDNELVDLKSLFLQIEVLRAEQPEALSSLSSTLSKANGHVQDIKDLADEYNGRLLTGFDRIKWVAEKSKISKLKQELREQRNRLDTLLIANTLSTSMKAQLAIRDIAHNTSEALNDHHRSVEEQLQRILSAVQSVPRVNASKGMAIKQQTTSEDIVSFNAFTFEPGCTMSCCCPCHKSFRYGLMGKLFLGYTGSFFGPIACKESFCRKSATSFKANISYYFPRWFMMRALEFQVRLSRLGEPTMSLTFRAVLPRTSKPFIAAAQGDVNQLYSMLGSRIIHPDIIESSFGRSLLEYAILHEQTEFYEVLLRAKADIHIQNRVGISAIDTAWYTILGEPKSCNSRQLSRVFTKYDDIDHWQLTVLHQIIFGFLHLDLKQTLEISSLTIDEPDVYGRTALWWACERADMKSIRTLLEHGANPNIIDREGFSPFLSVLSSECFKVNDRYEMATLMMMQGKVDLNHCTEQGWTPIYLATRWNDIRILELLFSNMPNFDINTREYNGKTALYLAAFDQNVSVVRYLLEKGADISIAEGIGGSNPIHVACTLDDLDALTSLLSFDCSRAIIARTVAGQTPLHLTALYSHPRLAAAILAHDINPDITNGEGQTPLVIAIMHDYIGIAEVLLSYGADIDQITPKGEDLLTTAVDYASVYLVKILLGHGAKPMEQSKTIPSEDDMDIISMSSLHPKTFDHAIIFLSHFPNLPIRNPTDSTVIHIATIRNDPDLLLALETVDLSRFDISAVNKNGMTPADYLEYGSMITERKAAFCRLLHRNHFTSQIICPSCGRRSDLGPVVEVESDEEDDYVDALSEVLVV